MAASIAHGRVRQVDPAAQALAQDTCVVRAGPEGQFSSTLNARYNERRKIPD